MDRLAGIEAKIERAEKHINDFSAEWIAFGSHGYELVADDQLDESGRRPARLYIKEELPASLSNCVGDAVNNLRSALDYLIYQLLDRSGVTVGPHHYFPIGRSPEHFESSYLGKIKGVGQDAEDLIKALKPYKGGTDGFWHLDELSKRDKHNILLTMMTKPPNVLALDLGAIFSSLAASLGHAAESEDQLSAFAGQHLFIRGTQILAES